MEAETKPAIDRASAEYWQDVWRGAPLPRPVEPHDKSLRNHVRRAIDGFLAWALAGRSWTPLRLIEVGCGHSVWLPYFACEHGFAVAGLDYSEVGCLSARGLLSRGGIEGEIRRGDLWAPPEDWLGAFDIVFTNGLVEHFQPTASVLTALAQLLRPGGLMITLVPNMAGWPGDATRLLNRPVFDIHVPLDAAQLADAHRAASLEVQHCDYLCYMNFGVVNLKDAPGGGAVRLAKYLAWGAMVALSAATWWLEDHRLISPRPNRRTSPYIACLARKFANGGER